jgi:hypothetical protein
MWEIVQEILRSPAGSFAFVASILSLSFFLSFRAGKIVEKFVVVNKLESNVDSMKQDLIEIKATLNIWRQENNQFTQTRSPISLSDAGLEVAQAIHVDNIVSRCWKTLDNEIKDKLDHSSNPYTVQEICLTIGKHYMDYLSDSEKDLVKNYAFQKGHNVASYDAIFGILIRDKFFKENNRDVDDVDKHDPQKNPV